MPKLAAPSINYRPYHHTDGKWYVRSRRGQSFYPSMGKHETEAEALITCMKTHGHDCQRSIDEITAWLAQNDPRFDAGDEHGWLA